jgi:hypothetical protein
MALDRLQSSTLTPAFTDLLTDLGDLVQKEMQLAKAEVTEKITSRLQASIWMAGAGLVALVAVLLVVDAAVFAIASVGLVVLAGGGRARGERNRDFLLRALLGGG